MAKKPSVKKPRVYKKPRYSKKRSTVPIAVKKYVNKTIHKSIETKIVDTEVGKTMANISNAANFASGNVFQLTPSVATNYLYTIPQGVTSSTRTGNTVKLRSAKIRFVMYPQAYNAVSNPNPKPLDVMMLILSTKKSIPGNNVSDIMTVLTTDILQTSGTSNALYGTLYDMVTPFNEDVVTIHKKAIFKLGATSNILQSGGNAAYANNDYKYNVIKSYDVTKYLPKTITFDDNINNSTSKQVFAIFSPVNADGTGIASTNFPCSIFFGADIRYEDA